MASGIMRQAYGTAKKISLFVDGREVAAATEANFGSLEINSFDVTIGSDDANRGDRYFEGKIADVRIWDTARTVDEITSHMHHFVDPASTGLVANWHLDDAGAGVATTVYDATNTANDGTILGDPIYTTEPFGARPA